MKIEQNEYAHYFSDSEMSDPAFYNLRNMAKIEITVMPPCRFLCFFSAAFRCFVLHAQSQGI